MIYVWSNYPVELSSPRHSIGDETVWKHHAVEDLFKVLSLGIAMTDLQLITERVLLSWSECITMVTLSDHRWVIDLPQNKGFSGTAAIHHMPHGWR